MSAYRVTVFFLMSLFCIPGLAQTSAAKLAPAQFDAKRAENLGADSRGMRNYVLVVLKSGPNKMPEGEARKAMFAGHFANMKRLSEAGKLVLAGPFDGKDGWRGLFVFAVADIEEAKKLTETDPVLIQGEMLAEYHRWYGSAAVMEIPGIHANITAQPF